MVAYPPWDLFAAQQIIERLQHSPGAVLPILHALQDHFGYVDREAVSLIADCLNVSRADVHGVISFYHDFRDHPPSKRVVKLCRAEACQAVGCEDLVEHLADKHAIDIDAPAAKNGVTLESVYCLGNCALGPSALVDGVIEGRLTPARLARVCGLEAEQ